MKRTSASTTSGRKRHKTVSRPVILSDSDSGDDVDDLPIRNHLYDGPTVDDGHNASSSNYSTSKAADTAPASTSHDTEKSDTLGSGSVVQNKVTTKYGNFFTTVIQNDGKYGKCLMCAKRGLSRLIKMTNSGTSGLQRHLRAIHGDEPSVKDVTTVKKNPSVNEEARAVTFDQRLAEWLAVKYLPFSFFDDDETQEFFTYLNENLSFPKRSSMRQKVMAHFNDMRTAVFATLSDVSSKFSLTIDGWTSIANRSYYGVTMHFIDDDWKLQSLPIDFVASNGSHTGKDIARIVHDVLEEFDIKSKIQGITLDNAAANTTFMEELGKILLTEGIDFDSTDCHFRCIAHILNLGVQDTLAALNTACVNPGSFDDCNDSDDETFDRCIEESEPGDVVTKIRKLFLKIKRSEQWDKKLSACCEAVNVKKLITSIDVPTRWNSTFRMLQTAVKLKPALNALLQSHDELHSLIMDQADWKLVDTVCQYLKPFDHLSTLLGAESQVTLPLVVLGFNMLIDRIEEITKTLNDNVSRTTSDEKLILAFEAGRDKMLKHYRKTNWVYGVALILDPRHKIETFSMTRWGLELKEESVRKFEEIFREHYFANTEASTSQLRQSSQDDDDSFNLYALFESTTQIHQATRNSEWKNEIERYCSEKRADGHENILQWWRKNSGAYPNLAKMARDILGIPATSVPSERLFSKAGLIIRKHRSRLNNESARSLLCLNGWINCGLKAAIYKKLNAK